MTQAYYDTKFIVAVIGLMKQAIGNFRLGQKVWD